MVTICNWKLNNIAFFMTGRFTGNWPVLLSAKFSTLETVHNTPISEGSCFDEEFAGTL